jgi:hypothetical protein
MRLPEFLGIGAEKCATTWLFRCLREHPQIYLPRIKEVHFFDREYDRGIEWYAKFFVAGLMAKCVGEVSPQYFHDPLCAQRIAKIIPNVKLILCLRNPIDRAYSQYWMDVRGHKANSENIPSFSEAIQMKPEYLTKGLYYDQLMVYLKAIPTDNILILFQTEIAQSARATCRKVYSFLGVDDDFISPSLSVKINTAAEYKNPRIFNLLQKFTRRVERMGLEQAVIWAKNNGIRDWILKKMEKPIKYPEMDQTLRAQLQDYYYDSNYNLSVLLGHDLSSWR